MAAPVRTGEELELRIDSLAYGGSGVARHDGFVVFVRGGLPGDRVRARVTKVKRGFAEAGAQAVLDPSADRVEAPCRHFGVCGGCRFQDLAYEAQIAAKGQQVRDALIRIGRIAEPPLEPIVPAASLYGYRNKLEYSFTSGEEGVELGFHRAGRWDEVIGIEECLLTTDLGNAIRLAVRDWAREERLEPYDQAAGAGYLRHLVVREGRNTGQALVVLVTAPGERFETGYLVDVLRRFQEVRSIHWAVNDTPAERTNLPTTLLWGDEAIEEQLLGLRFRLRPTAFLQTNTEMAEQLYALAREFAGLTGVENVLDLYCGTGTIGLALAGDARSVWGVEISEEAVACAVENAELNGIENARFIAGNVGQTLEQVVAESGKPDVVVVDPPRAGLAGKALRRTGALGASRIVYVSCNPTTLASDVKVLREEFGYELVRCRPVDMFPHTPHVESVSLLTAQAAGRSRPARSSGPPGSA
jgi:23S rRNA (uracil1939-C5)-methyltransferase